MGLDMYLSAKRYLWREESEGVDVTGLDIPEPLELKEISCRALYWRKANQIHGWFVRNVQDGEDDCNPYEVARSDLVALLDACRQVMLDEKLAPKLLPPAEGFFFGTYKYDESYFGDVQETAIALYKLLEAIPENSGWVFEYQSSW